jgi:hypothetical protein
MRNSIFEYVANPQKALDLINMAITGEEKGMKHYWSLSLQGKNIKAIKTKCRSKKSSSTFIEDG